MLTQLLWPKVYGIVRKLPGIKAVVGMLGVPEDIPKRRVTSFDVATNLSAAAITSSRPSLTSTTTFRQRIDTGPSHAAETIRSKNGVGRLWLEKGDGVEDRFVSHFFFLSYHHIYIIRFTDECTRRRLDERT